MGEHHHEDESNAIPVEPLLGYYRQRVAELEFELIKTKILLSVTQEEGDQMLHALADLQGDVGLKSQEVEG